MEEKQFERMLIDNKKMIYSIINNVVYDDIYSDYLVSEDDLFQEGCIALYNACMTFDPNLKVKFSTYAYLVIRRRIIHKYRELYRPLLFEKYSYDAIDEIDHCTFYASKSPMPENSVYLRAKNYELTLDEIDKKIVEMRKNNIPYQEIAKAVNLSPKQVDNHIYAIRKRYRAYLLKEKEI